MIGQIIFVIASFLMAGGGAWAGSYLREKGKNYASKEDIKTLTRLTEEIRSEVSGKMWLDQKRWDLKREYYWQLLGQFHLLQATFRDIHKAIPENISKHTVEQVKEVVDTMVANMKHVTEATDEVNRLIGIGRILLPQSVIDALNQFISEIRELDAEAVRQGKSTTESLTANIDAPSTNPNAIFIAHFAALKQIAQRFGSEFSKRYETAAQRIVCAARDDLLSIDSNSTLALSPKN